MYMEECWSMAGWSGLANGEGRVFMYYTSSMKERDAYMHVQFTSDGAELST